MILFWITVTQYTKLASPDKTTLHFPSPFVGGRLMRGEQVGLPTSVLPNTVLVLPFNAGHPGGSITTPYKGAANYRYDSTIASYVTRIWQPQHIRSTSIIGHGFLSLTLKFAACFFISDAVCPSSPHMVSSASRSREAKLAHRRTRRHRIASSKVTLLTKNEQ